MAPTWKTRDGRLLLIGSMDTDHIRNAIAMLERKGILSPEEFLDCLGCQPNGDMAYDLWESEIANARISSHLAHLREELARRKD